MSFEDLAFFFLGYEYSSSWVALLRVVVCGYVMVAFSMILMDAWDFSAPDGVFGGSEYLSFCKEFPQVSIFNIFPYSRCVHVLVFVVFYISGFFAAIGLFTGVSLCVFLICVISLQARLVPIMYSAADSVLRTMLLCLFLTNCGAAWSMDVVLGWNEGAEVVDGWAIRLFQVFICLVYLGSAMPKLHDKYWLNGEVVRNAVFSGVWGKRMACGFIARNTRFLSIGSLCYEYFAPFFLLLRETALPAVILGMFLHGGVAVFLRVGCFGPLMCIALLFFLNPK